MLFNVAYKWTAIKTFMIVFDSVFLNGLRIKLFLWIDINKKMQIDIVYNALENTSVICCVPQSKVIVWFL